MAARESIQHYDIRPGRKLGSRYEVLDFLGRGWEGEVYKVVETATGIERAAKLFYPQRSRRGKALLAYARKLNRLKHVPVLVQYHHQDIAQVRGQKVEFVVSEYIEGELLSGFLARQPGKRFSSFEALHILYALTRGIEPIHEAGEYHGDLHTDNVIIRRRGIGFDVKLLDFFDLGRPSRHKIQQDVFDLIYILYELVGGRRWYGRMGREIKTIVRGLQRSRIAKQCRNAGELRTLIENVEWDDT